MRKDLFLAIAMSALTVAGMMTISAERCSANVRQGKTQGIHSTAAGIGTGMESLQAPREWKEDELLDFLYRNMPLPDSTDYSREFYLENIRQSLTAREEMPWGKMVPEREFLHFVLPVRVNNENLDESRMVFYKELKDRVKGLSMTDAALEVNHWCHEKVTYTPSDARTSSPLASVKTAYGRCGEESTFTVAAMRSVGIPARQVYTPRWAHTDDNHAWVEVWTDGRWHFLGACEPEPVLDLGWFNAPASRGMLMHTDAFGIYDGPEEVIARTNCFTTINVTSNYAPTDILNVRVVDKAGNPVQADVEFKIYNYAELYTVVGKRCDENGMTSLRSGLGDITVWASKDGMFGIAKARTGSTDTLEVVLDKGADYNGVINLDIVPPVQRNTVPDLTEGQICTNRMRTAYEDSLRNAYIATFITREQAEQFAKEEGTDPAKTANLLIASRGNWQTIKDFIHQAPASRKNVALNLLEMIAAKDLRDITMDVLLDHFNNSPSD
ncbi:MAG: transglutaminase family protein, partial [Candidatus Cryptobacteroides sp.]